MPHRSAARNKIIDEPTLTATCTRAASQDPSAGPGARADGDCSGVPQEKFDERFRQLYPRIVAS
jgi:hypothetical protein